MICHGKHSSLLKLSNLKCERREDFSCNLDGNHVIEGAIVGVVSLLVYLFILISVYSLILLVGLGLY